MNFYKIFNFINLHNGEEERNKVLQNVKSNISFRGSNLWILACAIVIACVGLNVNSTAVIIGAMLISPLMGPIVGAGFALAIYDFELLKKSGKNLLIATLVSLVVASLYFFLSPFKESQSEIIARTSPNFYDVLIAFFGGLVGVIAITRVEKGNPIPGVAIATALMPPLCTAGYGIAIGNASFFVGAFYLYTINCFFICFSTFLIIKFLKYKPVAGLNLKYARQIKFGITFLIFVMVVPSFYFAYKLLNEKKYAYKVENFINNELTSNGYIVIYKNINDKSSPKQIELALLTKKFNTLEIALLQKRLAIYGINDTKLIIRQDDNDLKGEILSELNGNNKGISEKDIIIKNLRRELNVYKVDNSEVLTEMFILFPEIKNLSIGKHLTNENTDTSKMVTVVVYQMRNKKDKIDTQRVQKWLNTKFKTNNTILIKHD